VYSGHQDFHYEAHHPNNQTNDDDDEDDSDVTESGMSSGGKRRVKRSVVHLYDMVVCATGCNPLAYKGYGCYCGFLGSGLTVDGIDRLSYTSVSKRLYLYRKSRNIRICMFIDAVLSTTGAIITRNVHLCLLTLCHTTGHATMGDPVVVCRLIHKLRKSFQGGIKYEIVCDYLGQCRTTEGGRGSVGPTCVNVTGSSQSVYGSSHVQEAERCA